MNAEDIGRILDEIGERIGPAGEYAWQLAVRQVHLEGALGTILGTLLTLFFAAAIATGLTLTLKKHNRDKAAFESDRQPYRTFDAFGYQMVSIGVILFGGTALLMFASWAYTSTLLLLNPEYHAMIRLLDRVVP